MKRKILLPHFLLLLEEGKSSAPALRVIVPKRVGRAVDRNRIKRVIREFFRLKKGLPAWGCVICRVLPGAAEVKNAELFQELHQIV